MRDIGAEDELKSLPWFVKDKFICDRALRLPSNPAYDKSTLFVPADELSRMTPVMQ